MNPSNLAAFLDGYKIVCDDLGKACVDRSLKRHYADVCCQGDIIMQQILKLLDEGPAIPEALSAIAREAEDDYLFETVLDYLVDTLEEWYEQGECTPNPWWAD